jgi:hypothetical protein
MLITMKKILFSSIIAFLIISNISAVSLQIDQDELHFVSKNSFENDLDNEPINKLEWKAPPGHLPGTYQEYLSQHPLSPAAIKPITTQKIGAQLKGQKINLLINEDIYPDITSSISQYISDIELLGYSPEIYSIKGGTPEIIKLWIKGQYQSGSTGIVMIGDIIAAWAEISGSQFPCDLYYMDLDGTWTDSNGDGIYDKHESGSGDMAPEIYVGRIYASSLTYETDAVMLNDYFSKVHRYRIGTLTQPWHGLEYVEEDWYTMDVFLDYIYGEDVDRYDYGYFTTGQDYLERITEGHHFVQVCAHSYSGGHHFSRRPTEAAAYAHIYIYSPIQRNAKLLLGSDDGIKVWLNHNLIFTNDRYGGWVEDAYEIDVTLEIGWNQLLCKISQQSGSYKLSAQFTNINYETFTDLLYQMDDPTTHPTEGEYMRSWLLNGFHQDNSGNFWQYLNTNYLGEDESIIAPIDGQVMGGKTWTTFNTGAPYIDLASYCNEADFGVCYAFSRVTAPTSIDCQLWVGYDDGVKIWLNGDQILYDNRYGDYTSDFSKINVTLKPGENHLLIKVSEWMGDHGFSSRFCYENGSIIDVLSYDPIPEPISHIGSWVINGAYANSDQVTRLSTDYLGDEANVSPNIGDPCPLGVWERGIGNGCPFGLDTHFDHGDWVYSADIQYHDPPVLFYNLFACGPGRFTDENYLAGAYIFNTTYGLISVASAKSGSMLSFNDFTLPLSQGKSLGQSFQEWFTAQAPYVLWEQEWYYGMVLCGDPTLDLMNDSISQLEIQRPTDGVYFGNKRLTSFFVPIIIGNIEIVANASNELYGIDHVDFYINDVLQFSDDLYPYSFLWMDAGFFKQLIKVVAFNTRGKSVSRELSVWKFF